MSSLSLSRPLRRRAAPVHRSHRAPRFALRCEPLESRQLLSVAQASLGALGVSNPIVAQTQISIPTAFHGFSAPGFTAVDVEIGTFSGLSQIQITFFGGGGSSSLLFSGDEFFPSFPSVAFDGSGVGNGSGMGSLGSNANSVASGNPGVTSPSSPITTSITPLNPSLTATQTPGSITPVFIVPPPLPPIVVHLGSSVSPVTEQAVFSPLAALDEQPTSVTHFGQTLETELQRFFKARLSAKAEATPLLDYVEPFDAVPRPAAPAADPAPQVDHAPAPDPAPVRPLPAVSTPAVDTLLDLTDRGLMSHRRETLSSQADDRSEGAGYSWNLSTVFGAAVVAAGGYHLAIREQDRSNGRWVPRWVGSERPNKRKAGLPSR